MIRGRLGGRVWLPPCASHGIGSGWGVPKVAGVPAAIRKKQGHGPLDKGIGEETPGFRDGNTIVRNRANGASGFDGRRNFPGIEAFAMAVPKEKPCRCPPIILDMSPICAAMRAR